MDCKHEKLQIISTVPHGTSVICATFGCESHFERGEYIILTKAQHQLMQDTVEAGREISRYYIASNGYAYHKDLQKLEDALKALDALPEKGEHNDI